MAHPLHIANGLVLDFVPSAGGLSDSILALDSSGNVTAYSSLNVNRISSGGNLTESTSSILTITGGTGSVLTSGVSIQVKQSTTGQDGYLSSTDWNTFNNKLSNTLNSANVFVGNGSNFAIGVSLTGAIAITNTGATSINANYITNSMVNSSAAIAVSKLAAMSASLVAATDGSGFLTTVAGFTTTIAGYLTTITSNVQNQINTKLTVTLTSPSSGDVIMYNGSAWINSATGSGTLPAGGTANQYLTKIDGTNYNTQWSTLTVSKITDLTSTASELNLLHGVTTTTTQFNYLNTTTSDVQSQLNNKLSITLAQNSIFVGNASNVATGYAAGSNGQILQIVGGVPTWQTVVGTGSVTSIDVSGGSTGLTTSGGPITTTGTITLSGTVNPTHGGTGVTSYTTGDIIYASAANTLSKLAIGTNGYVLTVTAGVPTWTASSTSTTGSFFLRGNGAGGFFNLVSPSDGQLIMKVAGPDFANSGVTSDGTNITAGIWHGTKIDTIYGGTNINSYTTGDILYASATNVLSKLAVGTNGQVLTVSAGVPSWATASSLGWAVTGSTTITGNTTQTGAFKNTFALNGIFITQNAQSPVTSSALIVTGGAHTNTTATDTFDVVFNLNRTVQFTGSTGFPIQEAFSISSPTYAFVSATGTITDAATVSVTGAPIKGTNAALTNTHGLLIRSNGVGSATNSFGLSVNAMTGATNNYAAQFSGGLGVVLSDINLVLGTSTGTKIGTSASQKLSLWNATPIVQPTIAVASATRVAGAGTAVLVDDTYDGYTHAQIVRALRNMGALA